VPQTSFQPLLALLDCDLRDTTSSPPFARYLFSGNVDDSSGTNHGVVDGATLTEDRFAYADSAYMFDGDDQITIATPWSAGDEEFSLALWMKPTAGTFDGNWHGFIGYQGGEGGTRSPSLWIHHAGDNCNPICGGGDPLVQSGGMSGPLSDDGGDSDPDGVAQSGLNWDTRTAQHGDGSRRSGVIDGVFAVDKWVNIIWTHTPGGKDVFWKNGVSLCGAFQALVAAAVAAGGQTPPWITDGWCPDAAPHVDLHSHYRIGGIGAGAEFIGVIDEVSMYDYALAEADISNGDLPSLLPCHWCMSFDIQPNWY
jgi:hypothetical protein